MSELQQQVSRLRAENQVDVPVYAGTPSLFFNKKDAGSIDMETVFDAAQSGLQALNQYDGRFALFFENILHPSSQNVQRELLAPEETKLLNKRIADLLRLLTLFAGESSTHKVLEYLVRRYRVHEMNVDALMKCMIAQHDTKVCQCMSIMCDYLSSLNNSSVSTSELYIN
jgi:U3 small nucleolar RNA-associated protein 10